MLSIRAPIVLRHQESRSGLELLVEDFARDHGLSARERLAVLLAAQGYSSKETCRAMGCEVSTVNVFWQRIRKKTKLDTRLRVVARLLQRALPPADR
jgi:DNA-binding CsgD family transcriptional regulator